MLKEELTNIPAEEAKGVDPHKFKIFAGSGCKECGQSGYQGRIAIIELMPLSEKIKEMILARESVQKLLKQGQSEGMINMKQDGLLKVLKGITTIEEVMRVTKE